MGGRRGTVRRHKAPSPSRRRRVFRIVALSFAAVAILLAIPFGWTRVNASGHLYSEGEAPTADVAIVLGAQVAPDGKQPMPFLRGRLETAAALVNSGRVRVLLISGDSRGGSGNETQVMREYLIGTAGVPPEQVVTDPAGLDTYDSCLRARQVYGVTSALVVTQSYHLARAVTLCRHVGIDANGVAARCDGCENLTLAVNATRDFFACSKAAIEASRDRPSAVESPASPEITRLLTRP